MTKPSCAVEGSAQQQEEHTTLSRQARKRGLPRNSPDTCHTGPDAILAYPPLGEVVRRKPLCGSPFLFKRIPTPDPDRPKPLLDEPRHGQEGPHHLRPRGRRDAGVQPRRQEARVDFDARRQTTGGAIVYRRLRRAYGVNCRGGVSDGEETAGPTPQMRCCSRSRWGYNRGKGGIRWPKR